MKQTEKAEVGRQLAEKFWQELLRVFDDDDYRIRMVIDDLQDRQIKLHVELSESQRLSQ